MYWIRYPKEMNKMFCLCLNLVREIGTHVISYLLLSEAQNVKFLLYFSRWVNYQFIKSMLDGLLRVSPLSAVHRGPVHIFTHVLESRQLIPDWFWLQLFPSERSQGCRPQALCQGALGHSSKFKGGIVYIWGDPTHPSVSCEAYPCMLLGLSCWWDQ